MNSFAPAFYAIRVIVGVTSFQDSIQHFLVGFVEIDRATLVQATRFRI